MKSLTFSKFSNYNQYFGLIFSVLAGIAAFWLALLPVHTITTDLGAAVDKRVESTPDGIKYIWTRPTMNFGYEDVPRFAPLFLQLEVLPARPEGAPPATIEIFEIRNGQTVPIFSQTYPATANGIQQHTIRFEPTARSQTLFSWTIKSNGFRVPGDSRELGVRLKSATVTVSKSGLIGAVFKQPLFPATVLLLVAVAWFAFLVGLRFYETLLLLLPIGFAAGVLANNIIYESWWLVVAALLTFVTALLWQRWGRQWLAAGYTWRPFGVLLAGAAAFLSFFLVAPGYAGDIFYYREMLAPIMEYGPIAVYPKAPRLDYPPVAVFQLWFYGLLTQPFGAVYFQGALKLLMTLALPFMFGVFWLAGLRSGVSREQLVRTTWLAAFCWPVLFVPAVWVQADGWQMWLMALALLLVVWGRPFASAGVQAVAVLYKGQSWFLLPYYAVVVLAKFGWRKAFAAGAFCFLLIFLVGGLGFGFSREALEAFWNKPMIGQESEWGGINSFNLMHLLGYDKVVVPQPWLALSYVLLIAANAATMFVTWRRQVADTAPDGPTKIARQTYDWLLGSAFVMSALFFFWIRMHERYLYFGLVFLLFAAFYNRKLFVPALLLSLFFSLNVLHAYLPPTRDAVPHNFFFWRHFLKAELWQNMLSIFGIGLCLWIGWFYFWPRRRPDLEKPTNVSVPEAASVA